MRMQSTGCREERLPALSAMSIFDLHSAVLTDYRDFVRSFFVVADARVREFVTRSLDEEAWLWPDSLASEPLLRPRGNGG